MPTCPSGHQSDSDDYCDVCGIAIEQGSSAAAASSPARPGAPSVAATPAAPATPATPATSAAEAREPCPRCGAPRTDRFCEDCGYDFVTGTGMPVPAAPPATPSPAPPASPAPPSESGPAAEQQPVEDLEIAAGTWLAVIAADRAYYQRVVTLGGPDAVSLRFPPYALERRILLTGEQVRIGRRSVSQGLLPEIDLGQPPEDPGVSHLHAVLLAKPDGTWALVDPGSTNGTMLNETDDPVEVNTEIPLKHGDRIYLGAWTSITLMKEG